MRRLGAFLDDCAGLWFGVALPPAERAIDAAGWQPDEPSAYCPRCGAAIGPGTLRPAAEGACIGCAACAGRRGVGAGCVRLGAYTAPLSGWIAAIKYGARWEEMAEALGRRLGSAALSRAPDLANSGIIVPMPMPPLRRLARGIDHAAEIAAGAAGVIRRPVLRGLLAARDGPAQAARPAGARRREGGRRIRSVRGTLPLGGAPVLLVDDVLTTGASMRRAERLLRRAGAGPILIAVLAVAEAPGGALEQKSNSWESDLRPP